MTDTAELEAPTLASRFTIAVGPWQQNTPRQELTSFTTVTATFNFSTGDQLSFDVEADSPEAGHLDELATDVWLTGPVAQRYRVTDVQQEWGPDGESRATVTAVNYKRLLAARHVLAGGLRFDQVDQGEIIWQLVAHAQNRLAGSWGVTRGTVATGTLRDRGYLEGSNLGDLAENLQNVIGGPWWNIDANRQVQVRPVAGFATHATPIHLGVTASKLRRAGTAARFANAIFADAAEDVEPVWQATAGLATDPRGRWEIARGWPTVTQRSTLAENAAGALAEAASAAAAWTVELDPLRWLGDLPLMPGDFATLVVPPNTAAPLGPSGARTVAVQTREVRVRIGGDGDLAVTAAVVEHASVATFELTAEAGR